MQLKLLTLIIISFLYVISASVSAEDVNTEKLYSLSLADLLKVKISVASLHEETVQEAPGIITVISQEEIQGFQARNLGDVLNRIVGTLLLSPDVFIEQSLSMRGQSTTPYNNHILILQNGRPIRDPITGGFKGTIYAGFPLDAIDRIEIIRGPGSVLYGSTAYSGVINLVTNQVKENKLSMAAKSGSYANKSYYLNGAYKADDFSFKLNATTEQNEGPKYEFIDYDGDSSSANFDRELWSVSSNLSYKDFSANLFIADFMPYSLNGSETWHPGYINTHATNFFDLSYSTQLNKNNQFNISYTLNRHTWRSRNSDGTNANTTGKSQLLETYNRWESDGKWKVVLGAGVEHSEWDTGRLIPGEQGTQFIYSQLNYQIFSHSNIVAGAQWNKLEKLSANVSPRLGWISQINDNFTFKAFYSEAFRKGYPFETNFAVSVFEGNPDLEPEEIDTYELQLSHHTGKMESSLTYYNSTMKNLITREFFSDPTRTPPFYLQYLNGGEWDFWGLEYEGKFKASANLTVIANASHQQNTRDGIDNSALHPSNLIKAGILYHANTFDLSLFNSFYSKPYSTDTVREDSSLVNPTPEKTNLTSFKISSSFNKLTHSNKNNADIKLSLEVDNLFDEDFHYPDYPNKGVNSLMPSRGGRSWTLRADISF